MLGTTPIMRKIERIQRYFTWLIKRLSLDGCLSRSGHRRQGALRPTKNIEGF